MRRSTIRHTSPSQSVTQLALRREVKIAGYDAELLRDILWLTNAHDQLVAFPFFCKNLRYILLASTKAWGVSTNAFNIHEDSIKLLEWIADEETRLSAQLGDVFGLYPKHDSENPVMGKGITRHPVYAALCNSHVSDHLKQKFHLLQGHLLFAHATELHSKQNRDVYENYGEPGLWKGLPNSPALSSQAVRELSESQFADILLSLDVEQPPAIFSQSLNSLPHVNSSDFLNHLLSLRNFLQKAAGTKDWIIRDGIGGKGGSGGGKHIHGHVEISHQIYQVRITENDTDDEDEKWGDINQVTSIQPTADDQKGLLKSDLCPDEFSDQDLLLTGDDTNRDLSGGVAANSAAQMRHVLMSNQLFPWSYQQLTIFEVSAALVQCSDWVNSTFSNKNQSILAKAKDIKKLETICLMRVMLFTGSSIDRVRELLLLPSVKMGADSALAMILNIKGEYEWRVRAIRPQYKTNQTSIDGSDRQKTDYFTLPDTGFTSRYIELLSEQLPRADDKSEKGKRVFISHETNLRANLKKLLTELDPTGRLTESKLSKFLFFRILDESKGDVCLASMITGDEHRLAHVRLFYSMIPVERLQRIYCDATQKIVSFLFAAMRKENTLVSPLLTPTKDRYVGSRLCPTLNAVKFAIKRINDEIEIGFQRYDQAEVHNLHTLLAIWYFSFSTACRAIETPYMSLAEIDLQTGIALLIDKDDGSQYKARLTWLPPRTITQMEHYQLYKSELFSLHPHLDTESTPVIFFLELGRNGHLKTQPVRPKMMEQLMEPFLPYPANFHRRFMRTELLLRGCPTEAVDAFMGHWSLGEEPWASCSSFTFQSYREEMKRYLVPLLDELGLN